MVQLSFLSFLVSLIRSLIYMYIKVIFELFQMVYATKLLKGFKCREKVFGDVYIG